MKLRDCTPGDIIRMKPNTANLTVGETLQKSGLVRVWLKSGEGFWLDGKDEVFVVTKQ